MTLSRVPWRMALVALLSLSLLAPAAPAAAAPSRDAATDSMVALLPRSRETIVALSEAINSGDLARSKLAYAHARVVWEMLEVSFESLPELEPFDTAIDAREEDFPLGVNDPNWKGFHKIERGLWRDGTTVGLERYGQMLVADWEAFETEFRRQNSQGKFTPASLLDGAEDLLAEVATSKLSGEEERYSKLDILDFQANLNGAQLIFDAYRDQIAARDSALFGTIVREFQAARAAIAPYARSEVDVTNYDEVPQAARARIGTTFRALARSLERASQMF
jgi:iron uptake system component EfeO